MQSNFIFHSVSAVMLLSALVKCTVLRPHQMPDQPALYGPDDRVIILTGANLRQSIYNQSHAIEVEYYNSFCGFCRRFAPVWKSYADDIYAWNDILKVGAVDCAAEENSDICRDFEVMSYPTIRYYPPFYASGEKQLGVNVEHPPNDPGRESVVQLLAEVTVAPSHWPNLKPIQVSSKTALFDELSKNVKLLFLIATNRTSLAQEVALDLHIVHDIAIRQLADTNLAKQPGLYVMSRDASELSPIHVAEFERAPIRDAIKQYTSLNGVHLPEIQTINATTEASPVADVIDDMTLLQDKAIVDIVRNHREVVHQADIEMALKFTIFHEILQHKKLEGERFLALQRYLNVLQK